MSTPSIFNSHGLSEEALKKYWTATSDSPKRKKLRELIRDRIKEGIETGLKDHRIWWAVDLSYDAPFNQLAPTIVRDILSKHADTRDILDALKRWNVNTDDLITCAIIDGKETQVINVPAFFQVIVPLVKAYVTIRRAKLFNDRNIHPFFKFEPSKNTTVNRIIGEILTDIIAKMSTQYGYPAVLKQILLQLLQYGTCLQFPVEEWHTDTQLVEKDGKVGKDTLKEGLRYHLPHPSHFFYDLNHRPSTLNTDTGCQWAGYWRVNRYSDVADNERYWNREDITYGETNFLEKYKTYFSEVSPCSLAWPTLETFSSTGAGRDDRQAAIAKYTTNDRDKAIFTTELFMKLTPKEWDIGTYEYPVWMRFVIGGQDSILWNSALPYHPVIYWGYDPDEQRKRNSSLALEVLPFQDHFSNLCSQFIYSVKQNLTRMVWYDTAQVDTKMVEKVENIGKRKYSSVPFIPFNSRQAKMIGNDPDKAFRTVDFPLHPTNEVVLGMNQLLAILERVLVLSSQEIGQAASHEQTAEETRNISSNTLTRVNFTGSGVDDGIDAWKRQLYLAARAYLDDDVTAQASLNVPGAKEALEKLGFEVKDVNADATSKDVLKKVEVLAKMSKLELDSFVGSREGEDRTDSVQMANALAQVLQPILGNERLFFAVGEEQLVELINQFAGLIGMPKDFRLTAKEGSEARTRMETLAQQVNEMAAKIKETAVVEAVNRAGEEIAKPLVEQIVETDKKVQESQSAQAEATAQVQQLMQVLGKLAERLQAVEQITAAQVAAAAQEAQATANAFVPTTATY